MNQYWMFHSKSLNDDSFKNHTERVWRIVKYENQTGNKTNYYKIVQGDVIKFGRVRFQVKKLVLDPVKVEEMKGGDIDDNEYNSLPTKNNTNID